MKIFLIRPIDEECDEWKPWYNKSFGFVIRAETEDRARKIAFDTADGLFIKHLPWTDKKKVECIEIKSEGKEEIILQDFRRA